MPSPQQQLMQQLIELTEAVKDLAERPGPRPPVVIDVDVDVDGPVAATDADRVRQRVNFGYRALGTLTGRVSTATGREFDVRVVRCRRRGPGTRIEFDDLPPGADWVELRAGDKVETLRIRRTDNDPDRGDVEPRRFEPVEPIGSTVFLRTARGPLLAFGSRLAAVRAVRRARGNGLRAAGDAVRPAGGGHAAGPRVLRAGRRARW